LTAALQEADDINEALTKNVNLFVQFIEKNIIADILTTDLNDFEKKFKNLIENLKKERSRLLKATNLAI
jgi:hypothetical protein